MLPSSNMPDWVLAKYFDPEAERHQLLLHDYQQTEIQKMRSMENTKLIDCLHIPLKSYDDILIAFKHMLSNGFEIYLRNFWLHSWEIGQHNFSCDSWFTIHLTFPYLPFVRMLSR